MTTHVAAHRPGRIVSISAWVLQIALAVAIAPGGVLKLIGDPAMVDLFNDIGAGQWMRYLVGACEVAGGVGLLVPRVRALAALGLLLLLIGATITNVFVLDASPVLSTVFAVVALVIVLLRRHELPTRSEI
ncbi:MAG TPA: DoxX family protein [Jiangellales bacterium]|nr:DoxX family protein [Jiangellales bacterium]